MPKENGSWRDLPESIIKLSKRLKNVKEKNNWGTYYSRLNFNKPSYTITTHFHRLPNSANLHPYQNRMISIREGARLQSFKDNYIFYGSKTSQYKQIGNAVPPLLARAIAEKIKPYLNNYNFIDLFAGAGGMSNGFIDENYNLIAANEIDKNLFETYMKNHAKYNKNNNLILGDITKKEIKNKIINIGLNNNVGIIMGGIPCQGFSSAGLRNPNDHRNKLYLEFLDIVKTIKPEIFIIENVIGLLSMEKGKIIKKIIKSFEDIGYYVNKPFKLNAEEYGVPQLRRRIFIIGSLNKIEIKPPEILFSLTNNNLPNPITSGEAIKSLPKLKTNDGIFEMEYNYTPITLYDKLMNNEITFKEFYFLKINEILKINNL
ncbi:MAG TPA: DNA (cytosine-5-)-methyltransferase [archaeon]|nr:DNA (cytosine-5-)-methyltransferase [archaeon]